MHPNPAFRGEPHARNLEFARTRGYGVLAVNADGGPLMSHLPFAISPAGDSVELHLVRSNPILALLDAPAPAVIAVEGPDGYVSPDWYGAPDQVPTWNYVAVHLRGRLERRPAAELGPLLDRLAAEFEARLAPKPAWTRAKMDASVLARLQRQIAPCRLAVDAVDGTWKLGQNKPPAQRLAAAGQVAAGGIGSELAALAALMRGHRSD